MDEAGARSVVLRSNVSERTVVCVTHRQAFKLPYDTFFRSHIPTNEITTVGVEGMLAGPIEYEDLVCQVKAIGLQIEHEQTRKELLNALKCYFGVMGTGLSGLLRTEYAAFLRAWWHEVSDYRYGRSVLFTTDADCASEQPGAA
jgi:hypothetical protein